MYQQGGSVVKGLAAQSLWPAYIHQDLHKAGNGESSHKEVFPLPLPVRACALVSRTHNKTKTLKGNSTFVPYILHHATALFSTSMPNESPFSIR